MTPTTQSIQQHFEAMNLESKRASITEIISGFDDTDILQHNIIQLAHRLEPLSEESCQIVWKLIQEMALLGSQLKQLSEAEQQKAIKQMIAQHEQLAHQQAEQADADLLSQLQ